MSSSQVWGGDLIVCDGFDSMPQSSGVPEKWSSILCLWAHLASLTALFSLALAVLRAAMCPDLKAESLCLRRAHTSATIHGFSCALILMSFVAWTSSLHFWM